MDKDKQRNDFTSTTQDKPSGDILNPFTGQYRKADDGEPMGELEKSDEAKWPSISDVSKRNTEPEQKDKTGQVSKSTDENPFPSLTAHLGDDTVSKGGDFEKLEKSIKMDVPIFISKDDDEKDEHIVMGVVYEPDTVDAQGDEASADEIKKAAYDFMENSKQAMKVQHKGGTGKLKILESYITPAALTIAGKSIKKGSWVITARVLSKTVWAAIKAGKLTGFSMAGTAKVDEN